MSFRAFWKWIGILLISLGLHGGLGFVLFSSIGDGLSLRMLPSIPQGTYKSIKISFVQVPIKQIKQNLAEPVLVPNQHPKALKQTPIKKSTASKPLHPRTSATTSLSTSSLSRSSPSVRKTFKVLSPVIAYTHPKYPPLSRLKREEGVVSVKIEVQKGKITKSEIMTSSGFTRLDQAALHAIQSWGFRKNYSGVFQKKIAFKLRERP